MSDTLYNYNKALRLYSEGIQHQMDYELIENRSDDQNITLSEVIEFNQRLYEYMKSVRSSIGETE
jgi:hypothetical protein